MSTERNMRFTLSLIITGTFFAAAAASRAADQAEVTAFSGSPFGVGYIRVTAGSGSERQSPDVTYQVEASDDRIFYPTYVRESLPGAVDPREVSARGAYFLFKGEGELTVRFHDGATTTRAEIKPVSDAAGRQRLLERWWAGYQQIAHRHTGMPVVENYTTHMLARRLGLMLPPAKHRGSWNEFQLLGSFLGFEEMRLAMQAERMLDAGDRPEPADQPLPAATLPPPIQIPDFEPPALEPLAGRVPEECFYVRFGSYGNYRWFRDTMNTWGGNLREIVATRSLDYDIEHRLERQLVLKDSDLGKLLGDAAISDMAVIGTDTFVREGAALGVLFRQNQHGFLKAAILSQRAAAVAAGGVTEQTLDIEGKSVSLLTSPGNVVRSYYVADGEYHFVTNCSMLARRFVETGKGIRPVSGLKEFQYARTKHSAADGKAILAYLSDPFIRQLVSPQYRVEMTRRMRAEADVELVSLARLAAIGEQAPHGSVDELVAGGFLPAKFGKRADETLPLIVEGKVVDSLRGARRSFLPVPDVLVPGVTKSEAEAYDRFASSYQALYRRMDPISISLAREPVGQEQERITLDLSITPFTRQNLGGLSNWLAPPSPQQIVTGPEVLVFLELGARSRLFGGLVDSELAYRFANGQVTPEVNWRNRPPLFIGEHTPAFRQMLNLRGEKSQDGYFSNPEAADPERSARFGFDYGREWGDWWAAALRKDTLPQVTPGLALADGSRSAQLRLRIGDLGKSKLAPLLRAGNYVQDRLASQVNARLLDSFTEQLKLKEVAAPIEAQAVLGAAVVCPLGGEYRRDPPDYQFSSHQPWYSTAWPAPEEPWKTVPFFERMSFSRLHEPPAGYSPHLLNWFNGLVVEVKFEDQTMLSHVELTVQKLSGERGASAP